MTNPNLITCIERPPMDKIQYLLSLKKNEFPNRDYEFKSPSKNWCYDIARDYITLAINNKYNIKCSYNKESRCYQSVQKLPREVRGFLYEGITTDIDMINSCPTILKYICFKNNIDCPELKKYVENRSEILIDTGLNKIDFISCLNRGTSNRLINDPVYKKFEAEISSIRNVIISLPEYNSIVKNVPHDKYNINGSSLNRILYHEQCNIINIVFDHLKAKNMEIMTLMFDGLLVYGNYYDDKQLLNDIEKIVEDNFKGLSMGFSYKSHESWFKMPDNFKGKILDSYESVRDSFNINNCKILDNNIFVCILEKNDYPVYKSEKDMISSFKHVRCFLNGKDSSFINKWLLDPQMNYKKNMDLYPPGGIGCPDNCYNLWQDFKLEKIQDWVFKEHAVDRFKHFIKTLCNNEDNVSDYIINFIGQMIQFPAIKPTCNPIFIGKEGCGKSKFIELLKKLLGKNKILTTCRPDRDIFGNFNGQMENALLVNLNEVSKKHFEGSMDQFKDLVTEPTITISEKFLKNKSIKSFQRFITTTNKEEPINIDFSNRRPLIINCSDELKEDFKFFKAFTEEIIDDDNAMKTIYEYLKALPNLVNFQSFEKPITQIQIDLCESNIPIIKQFIDDLVDTENCSKQKMYKTSDIHLKFVNWCDKFKIQYNIDRRTFILRVNKLNIDGLEYNRSHSVGWFTIDYGLIKQNLEDLDNLENDQKNLKTID
jgi:hypothetical protein